jgi:hypothetical protein
LGERLTTQHRNSVVWLADRIQQRFDQDLHGQQRTGIGGVRSGDVAKRSYLQYGAGFSWVCG